MSVIASHLFFCTIRSNSTSQVLCTSTTNRNSCTGFLLAARESRQVTKSPESSELQKNLMSGLLSVVGPWTDLLMV